MTDTNIKESIRYLALTLKTMKEATEERANVLRKALALREKETPLQERWSLLGAERLLEYYNYDLDNAKCDGSEIEFIECESVVQQEHLDIYDERTRVF